jgi:hypothetical protein
MIGGYMGEPIDFKLVLDQFNRQVSFARDIAQKAIASLLAYTAFYFNKTEDELAKPGIAIPLLLFTTGVTGFFLLLQYKNSLRCRRSYETLQEYATKVEFPDLTRLGILQSEARLAIRPWTGAFILIYLAYVAFAIMRLVPAFGHLSLFC